MPPPTPIEFVCALPPEALRFESMSATQGISALDQIELQLLSAKPDLAAEDLLGLPAGVRIEQRGGSKRHFNGIVTRFGTGRSQGRWYRYQATLRPWLWFLTQTTDCRIFQDKTVPQIVEAVFGDHSAIANFEFKLYKSYRTRVYCVQYRESDFNFVARLLEEEGIYWYLKHEAGSHQLVLVDDIGALAPAEGAEKLPYYANTGQVPPNADYVASWSASREVRTGKVALTSYDFERPSTGLAVDQTLPRSHKLDDLEQFDFNGEYIQAADGQHLADCRVEELQCGFERLAGRTNALALSVGALFTLERHPRADQNAQYLCLNSSVAVQVAAHEGGTGADQDYQCSFAAAPSAHPFRPARRTPKPFVQGPQTAVVVGPPGEELFTDKYGRVKVQFHWDRYGQKNEKSSCWMRVSQPWAGKSWGAVSIPRIGQEVVVSFLEGDPDQPLITGRVYNAEQMPPFALPEGAVISGIKSKTHKGQGFNELSMDDTPGKEKVNIHGQYDMATTVLHDQTNTVKNNKTTTVDGTFTETIKKDTKITISEGTYSHDVATGTATYHVQAALTETYDATQTTKVQDELKISTTAGPINISADANEIFVKAATKITLEVGASKLMMDAAGNISLTGVNVTVKGSAMVTVKGGIVHSEADSEHQTKGAVVLSDGSATNTVKGGMVMLNP
jgi:type VI secretion system secreted protein VgrG